MHQRDFLQLALFIVGLIAITPPLGKFMARVFAGERHSLSRLLAPVERCIYKLSDVDPAQEASGHSQTVRKPTERCAGLRG
jgi:K+-transporting ATPase ATPase A chain